MRTLLHVVTCVLIIFFFGVLLMLTMILADYATHETKKLQLHCPEEYEEVYYDNGENYFSSKDDVITCKPIECEWCVTIYNNRNKKE